MKDGCFYHQDRIYFEDVKRALRNEKITEQRLLSYLAMAVCSCRRKVDPLPCSNEEMEAIVQYFTHNVESVIKTQELKRIIEFICNANGAWLDNSYKKFLYIIHHALQKDYSLLLAERKYNIEEKDNAEDLEESSDSCDSYDETDGKFSKDQALKILSKRRKKFPIDKEVVLPLFPGNMKYLYQETGRHFNVFSKKNNCLVFDHPSTGGRVPKTAQTSVNICCKSEEEFKRVSKALSQIAETVQMEREMNWCQRRGVDYGIWKALYKKTVFKYDEEEWEALCASKPKPVECSSTNVTNKCQGQAFRSLDIAVHIVTSSRSAPTYKLPRHPINIRNGRIIGKNRFEDRIRRERERRRTFCESVAPQKDSRSSKSYTEESFSDDFKSFVTDRYEKKLLRDKKTGGKKERISAQVLQGGHCINCLKPFESLKAEPNARSCVYHSGFINSYMVWSCCGEAANNKLSPHKQHVISGCSMTRHNWRPHKRADRSKKRNR